MNNARDYSKLAITMPGREIKSILDEFEVELSKMKGKCMDIGCGPGNVSREIILPKLSSGTILTGIDISKEMIEHARIANSGEKRMTFEEMDIETTDLLPEDIEKYDNGVSFFCLNWIQNLKRCYENIFKMLRPGGTALFLQLCSFSVFPAYIKLAKDPRYKDYTKDVFQLIPPLSFEGNPRAVLTKVLREVGFEVLHCSQREKMWEFKNPEQRKALLRSVNPFVDRMPKNIQEEYMEDLMQETLKQGTVFVKKCEIYSKDQNREQNVFDLYEFLVTYIKKPDN